MYEVKSHLVVRPHPFDLLSLESGKQPETLYLRRLKPLGAAIVPLRPIHVCLGYKVRFNKKTYFKTSLLLSKIAEHTGTSLVSSVHGMFLHSMKPQTSGNGLRPFVEPPSVEDSPESLVEHEQGPSETIRRISESPAPPPFRRDGTLDYDALYEDNADDDCDIAIHAFYAEHYNKRITFCAHVWTKSKFLGLSIGVHNIGQGCVSVLDYDEEYIVTFPNGYGRSILTVPWIELGGSVTITCAKTGYHANVEFLTKPFYGGKKHRITSDVYMPNEKKPFLSIAGEWNGTMDAKWADGRMETFVDVNKITVVKKIVRPIADQSENESRRLWKEVTAGLRYVKKSNINM
ncbi:Oxysterol-binding protein-related protein 9 [Blattella germanica]|nr:Oxysterol-binding protein-related protein 9 [Blattella germanica]